MAKVILNSDRVRELLVYEEGAGVFRRRRDAGIVRVVSVAGKEYVTIDNARWELDYVKGLYMAGKPKVKTRKEEFHARDVMEAEMAAGCRTLGAIVAALLERRDTLIIRNLTGRPLKPGAPVCLLGKWYTYAAVQAALR